MLASIDDSSGRIWDDLRVKGKKGFSRDTGLLSMGHTRLSSSVCSDGLLLRVELLDSDLLSDALMLPPTSGRVVWSAYCVLGPPCRTGVIGPGFSAWLDKERDDLWREALTKLPLLPPSADSSPHTMISIKFLSSLAM